MNNENKTLCDDELFIQISRSIKREIFVNRYLKEQLNNSSISVIVVRFLCLFLIYISCILIR